MAYIITSKSRLLGSERPYFGVEVDRSHPMARGLELVLISSQYSGAPVNLHNGDMLEINNGGVVAQADGWYFDATSATGIEDPRTGYANPASALAARVFSGFMDATPLDAAPATQPAFMSRGHTAVGEWFFRHDNSGNTRLYANSAVGAAIADNFASFTEGTRARLGFSYRGTSATAGNNLATAYAEGVGGLSDSSFDGGGSNVKALTIGAGSGAAGRIYKGHIFNATVWNRELSDAEHASLARFPYQFLKRKVARTYFMPTAAAPAASTDDVFIITSKSRSVKPPRWPYTLSADSPLAEGMLSGFVAGDPYSPLAYDLVNKSRLDAYVNRPAFVGSQLGSALRFNPSSRNGEALIATSLGSTVLDGAEAFTMVSVCRFTGDGTGLDSLIGQWNSLQGSSDGNARRAFIQYDSVNDEFDGFVFTSSGISTTASASIKDDRFHWVGLRWSRATLNGQLFLDGVAIGTPSTTGDADIKSTSHSKLFEMVGGTNVTNIGSTSPRFDVKAAALWDRALTDEEMWALYAPQTRWSWVAQPSRKTYFMPTAAAAAETTNVFTIPRTIPARVQPPGQPRLNQSWALGEGLQAYYPLAGNAFDISPHSNHLVTTNGRWEASGNHQRRVFDMDATGDYIQYPGADTDAGADWGLQNQSTASLSFWAYFDGDPAATEFMAGFVDTNGVARYFLAVANYPAGAGTLQAFAADRSAYVVGETAQYTGVADGFAWHHIVMTANVSTGGFVKLYVDGALVDTGDARASGGSSLFNADGARFSIGRDNGDTARDFLGKTHNVGVWFRELSAADVAHLYAPQTRWNVYAQPSKSYFMPTAVAAGGFSAWFARVRSGIIGQGLR